MRVRTSFAAALLLFLSASASADGIDLQPVRDRVAASLQSLPATSRLRKRYLKLDALLKKPDLAGLADDFAKLGRVAKEYAGKLAADTALGDAVAAAIANGAPQVVAAEATAATAIADIPSATTRRKESAAILRARRLAKSALAAHDGHRDATACRQFGRAARLFESTAASAAALAAAGRGAPAWQIVLRDRPAELLSVWVSRASPPVVYAVGAGDADGPTFLRGGPEGFVRIPVTASGDLWWVQEVPGAGIWAAGTDGLVVHYDPASGAATDVSTGKHATLFGLWGSGPSDVWTVGAGSGGRALLHWDGTMWNPVAFPPDAGGFLYKIEGPAPNDLYACGTEGLLMHWDGATWTTVPSGTGTTLLTIAFGGPGNGMAIAVGEVFAAEIIERAPNGTWAPVVLPDGISSVAGVSISENGEAWASGYHATVLRRTNGHWVTVPGVPFGPNDGVDLHALQIDVEGGVWFAGGDITNHGKGTLLYYGPRALGTNAAGVFPHAPWSTVQSLLTNTCAVATCHITPEPGGGLDLSTPALVATSLRRIPSTESPLLRVVPGRPSGSYVWQKLEGTQESVGGTGVTMPKEGTLTPEQIDQLRAWILEGAPAD